MNAPWTDHAPAPNGKPISENFATWFGDSALRDREGHPVVVYRGDKEDVTEFDRGNRRETGLFFAVEKERAAFYGEAKPYVLKASNPLDLRDTYGQWSKGGPVRDIVESLFSDHYDGGTSEQSGEPYTVGDVIDAIENGYLWKMENSGGFHMRAWRDLQSLVEAAGFDALIVPDDGEGVGMGIDYVVFRPEQVKSLDRNTGLFLLDSPCTVDVQAAADLVLAKQNAVPSLVGLFHGTPYVFENFDAATIGKNFGVEGGFFFTNEKFEAERFAGVSGRVIEADLAVENPFTLHHLLALDPHAVQIWQEEGDTQSLSGLFDRYAEDILASVHENGHDGVVLQHEGEILAVALRDEQIGQKIAPEATVEHWAAGTCVTPLDLASAAVERAEEARTAIQKLTSKCSLRP